MNNFNTLFSISPIDGRYQKITESLRNYFSEYALIKARVFVEIEYFVALCKLNLPQLTNITDLKIIEIREIYNTFSEKEAQKIKEIEQTTNHDVKAVEYYLKDKFEVIGVEKELEFIHFGLTSQDINNTATPLLIKGAFENEILPLLNNIIIELEKRAIEWQNIPMLARTHGQPATPTTIGKEFYVFVERIKNQIELLKNIPFAAKFGGATGNFNAHKVAFPNINWVKFANTFVEDNLKLKRLQTTTQIEHYDYLAAFFDAISRINNIFIDFDKDMWTYISIEYFKQKVKQGEVGSSAMPHKVNPIDFENSEGNLLLANSLYHFLSSKLPISRLQRDLTDSTVSRNIGVPIAHTIIGWKSLLKGVLKSELNEAKLNEDLEQNWSVVAEAIQTILRRENYPKPYEALKDLTRGKKEINKATIHYFIDNLNISNTLKSELKAITPFNYFGIIEF